MTAIYKSTLHQYGRDAHTQLEKTAFYKTIPQTVLQPGLGPHIENSQFRHCRMLQARRQNFKYRISIYWSCERAK